MEVRQATTPKDIDRMIELGRKMHAESRYAHLPYDTETLRGYGRSALANPKEWGVFFVDKDGETVAMVAVYKVPFYFSKGHYYATDFFLYVEPSTRGGLAAARCLRRVEEWGKTAGIEEICFGISAGIDNSRAERFYAGMGYAPKGSLMVKEIS